MNEISIIIPTKNRINDLKHCIDSIGKQTKLPNELIIIDSSDKPESTIRLEAFHIPKSIKIKHIINHTFLTKARNIGLNSSTSDIIIYVDDDVILHKKCVEEIADVFNIDIGKKIGMVFCRATEMPRKNRGLYYFFLMIMNKYRTIFLLERHDMGGKFLPSGNWTIPLGGEIIIETDTPNGDIYALRREVNEEFKWDEKLPGGFYGDDVDLAYRVSRKYKNILNPRAMKLHKPSSVRPNEARRIEMKIIFQNYFIKKHFPTTYKYRFYFWWSIIGLSILVLAKTLVRKDNSIKGIINGLTIIFKKARTT